MKKSWPIILSIYAVIITIACAVLGVLYFIPKNDGGNGKNLEDNNTTQSLSYYEAKSLVNKVYNAQVAQAAKTTVSTLSLEYKDYDKNEIEANGGFNSKQYNKTLTSFNQILNNGWATDVWLKRKESTQDYTNLENGTTDLLDSVDSIIYASEFFKCYINNNSVTLEVIQSTSSKWFKDGIATTQHSEKYTMSFLMKITQNGEYGWKTDFYEKHYFGSVDTAPDYRVSLSHVQYECEEEKIVRMKVEQVSTTLKTFKSSVQDSEISSYGIYDCNVKTHKLLFAQGPYEQEIGITNFEKLNEEDTVENGKSFYSDVIKVLGTYSKESNFTDYVEVSCGK